MLFIVIKIYHMFTRVKKLSRFVCKKLHTRVESITQIYNYIETIMEQAEYGTVCETVAAIRTKLIKQVTFL